MGISLGFGGATLTNLKSLKEVLRLLDIAFDFGIRHFDTAPLYGQGYSEVIYGMFLKDKRQQITLTTKFGLGEDNETEKIPVSLILPVNYLVKSIKKKIKRSNQENNQTYSGSQYRKIEKSSVQKSFEKSLKRLKTDYVDYYLLHEGLPSFLTEEAWAYLLQLKKENTVRNIGMGTNVFAIKTLNTNDVALWDVLQYDYSNPLVGKEIMVKFPEKVHFHHSCLRNIDFEKLVDISPEDRGGYLLAKAALNNPNGKIIFSTRSQDSLKKNINAFLKYLPK
jgi:aryl-alcohol dehydrogenase-like predicted oxidoreductase